MTSMQSTFDEFVECYEEACQQGLSYTGESRDYFARARVRACAEAIRNQRKEVRSILDYGCGIGHCAPILLEHFPGACVVGLDNSAPTIVEAQRRYEDRRCRFVTSLAAAQSNSFDAAYCNGVFHHIPVPERLDQARMVLNALRPGGWFMLWENNPLNPGTRYVMSRIPFDRDAITLTAANSRSLLLKAGFQIQRTSYHFFFPRMLRCFRGLESRLSWVPLGGQYCVWATKPNAV
jgi:SAM-dependent methyltransferase